MNYFRIIIVFVFAAGVIACGDRNARQASLLLGRAQTLYDSGDIAGAMAATDSVLVMYKGARTAFVAAGKLRALIVEDIISGKQNELDTLLQTIEGLKKNFVATKNEFDRYTQYIHKRQDATTRWNKSFIQVHLDETGKVYISSNYYGDTWLNHTGIRVYDRDIQAKTKEVPKGDAFSHYSDFMDVKWEKVTYVDGADNGVLECIAANADRNLKAVFLGTEQYYIILEEYDKQAMVEALALSNCLTRKVALENAIMKLRGKN